jgi:hypothetical protein
VSSASRLLSHPLSLSFVASAVAHVVAHLLRPLLIEVARFGRLSLWPPFVAPKLAASQFAPTPIKG